MQSIIGFQNAGEVGVLFTRLTFRNVIESRSVNLTLTAVCCFVFFVLKELP